jgi:Fe/S biogenesis protein NfuA
MTGFEESTLTLTITDPARARILDLLATEPDSDTLAVWLEVGALDNDTYTYEMYFDDLAGAAPQDTVETYVDLTVVIPHASVAKLRGASIVVSGERIVVRNPNRPPKHDTAVFDEREQLTGDLAERVMRVLDEQINPAIAHHGGRADLVAVQERIVYLRLSGGCQGCGIAGITIKQGIEVAILDAVPEIAEVRDITDHASGATPFYESADPQTDAASAFRVS